MPASSEIPLGEQILGVVVGVPFAALILFALLRTAIAMRHWLLWQIARFALICIASLALIVAMSVAGLHGWWKQYVAIALATPLYALLERKRSRRIPAATRQAVIERHIWRHGSFDPKTHCIDHWYPFSKGGGHTMDNLRVVLNDENRKKGSKTPDAMEWLRFTFRRQ